MDVAHLCLLFQGIGPGTAQPNKRDVIMSTGQVLNDPQTKYHYV